VGLGYDIRFDGKVGGACLLVKRSPVHTTIVPKDEKYERRRPPVLLPSIRPWDVIIHRDPVDPILEGYRRESHGSRYWRTIGRNTNPLYVLHRD